MKYKNITHCRLCYSNKLNTLIEFEPQYIASTFVENNDREPPKIPMTLLMCENCKLVQLKETVNSDLLYKNYFYRSNVSDTMNRDLRDVVRDACSRVNLNPGDAVLDIGCNDGLMLTFFPSSVHKLGIDPAKNIDRSAINFDKNTRFITDYFPSPKLEEQFKIITATACFYDLDDPNQAVQEIKTLLAPDGVAVIQVSYLYDTIKDMNFYDICHEHLEYYSLHTLNQLMRRNGLNIVDASTNAVNGGSLRIIVKHTEQTTNDNIKLIWEDEDNLSLSSIETYQDFENSITTNAAKVKQYIQEQSGLVIGLGASTKGNVLLQICGITKEDLPYISERNPFKVGLRTQGIDMELISEEAARGLKPACMFVIPWNFKDEIVAREQEYIENGGKLLFIMPRPYYIDKDGEHDL